MSQNTAKKTLEWAIWYKEHKNDGMSLSNRVKFLQKMVDGLLDLYSLLLMDMRDLEEGKPKKLVMPVRKLLKNKRLYT